jgi:isopenicillin-N N-acyltransferase-like protein
MQSMTAEEDIMEEGRFPVVEVEGTPFEMGYHHGSELRDVVALSLETFRREMTSDPYGLHGAGAARPMFEQVLDAAAQSIPLADEYAPDLVEELRGLAEGSGLAFEEIFALNTEVVMLETPDPLEAPPRSAGSCSTYAVSGEATADGHTYVGGNIDWYETWLPSSVIVKGKPAEGLPFVVCTWAGCIGRPGMNPYLGFSANGLFPNDAAVGVPYTLMCRKVLQQSSVEDALAVVSRAKRITGLNYTLADAEGKVAALETTARRTAVVSGVGGKVIHTNHFTSDALLGCETMKEGDYWYLQSHKRFDRLGELLMEKEPGSITLEDLKLVHRDHGSRPDSICQHGDDKYPGLMTLASVIMQPGGSRMLAACGHPCEHEFVEYTL